MSGHLADEVSNNSNPHSGFLFQKLTSTNRPAGKSPALDIGPWLSAFFGLRDVLQSRIYESRSPGPLLQILLPLPLRKLLDGIAKHRARHFPEVLLKESLGHFPVSVCHFSYHLRKNHEFHEFIHMGHARNEARQVMWSSLPASWGRQEKPPSGSTFIKSAQSVKSVAAICGLRQQG